MNRFALFTLILIILSAAYRPASSISSSSYLSFTTLAASSSNCSAGSYVSSGGCTNCTAGTFSQSLNATACFQCPRGTYNNLTNATTCSTCPILTSTDNAGGLSCTSCIGGKFYQLVNISTLNLNFSIKGSWGTCEICPKGRYSDVNSTDCTTCPLHLTTVIVLGEDITDCSACETGYYGDPSINQTNTTCTKCVIDNGITCPEGSIIPYVTSGYFRSPTDVTYAYECIPTSACNLTGYSLVTNCNAGYSGFVCGDCAEGYYRLDYFCLQCMSIGVRVFLLLLLIAGCTLILVRLMLKKSKVNVDARIALQAIQIVGLYSNISTKWPQAILVVLQIASLSVYIFISFGSSE